MKPDPDRTWLDPAPFGATGRGAPAEPALPGVAPEPTVAALVEQTDASDDDPTVEPPTERHASGAPPLVSPHRGAIGGTGSRWDELRAIGKDLLKRHEKKIWWLHTAWALSLGTFVATFAQKGFERARMLTLTLVLAWLLVVFFFRFFGTGQKQDFMTAWPGARRRFFLMTYGMKNLFQGMLFYLLPFYWKSSSFEAKTQGVLVLIAGCAVISTLDLVFDRVLLRFKLIASAFFAITFFGCVNLVIPVLLPNTPTLATLLVSSGLSVATFLLFHLPIAALKRPFTATVFGALVGAGVLGAYVGRRAMPPVPMFVKSGGVGTSVERDGALAIEVRSLRVGSFVDLYAVTDVSVIGRGDAFRHVWRRGSQVLAHTPADVPPASSREVVRVASRLPADARGRDPEGHYTVDVETESGQIVGRVSFDIRP